MAIKELYKVLKDHRNPFMQELVITSFQHQSEFRDLVGLTPLCSQQLEECGTENVVRVALVNPSFPQPSTRAIEKIIEAKLQLHSFCLTLSETSTTSGIEKKRFLTICNPHKRHHDCFEETKLSQLQRQGVQKRAKTQVHLLIQVRCQSVHQQPRYKRAVQIPTLPRNEKNH